MIHQFEQYSEDWWAIRLGIPTASAFSKLLTPAKLDASKQLDGYAMELAAEKWSKAEVDSWTGNAYTENGNELEPRARAFYSMRTGRTVQEIGFITSDNIEAGASPDGLADDVSLEIKSCGAKQHIACLQMDTCPNDYVLQTQGQILIGWDDGVRSADLLMYSETLPPKIFHIEPIQKIQDALKAQIEAVCKARDKYYEIIKAAA